MLIVDLVIVCLTVAVAVWGYSRGVTAGGLVAIGFAAGALLGSRLAPLVLEDGLHDPFAPVLALPGALVFGAAGAAAVERVTDRVLDGIERRGNVLDGVAGGLLAVTLCLVAVWVIGAVAVSFDDLEDSVRDSAVVDELTAALPPPGPLLDPVERRDQLPLLAGPRPGVRAATPTIKRDRDVEVAARSVVKMSGSACGKGLGGSGWIAGDGIVVTNAHVVEGADEIKAQVRGRGRTHDATPVWYDDRNDLAILTVRGIRGVPALAMARDPEPGTPAAVLGFPGGGPYTVTAARLGNTTRIPGFRFEGGSYNKREVTTFVGRSRPGNSGGPVVDGERRVVTMVRGGRRGGHGSYGVPIKFVRSALDRARPRIRAGRRASTGHCDDTPGPPVH